MNEDVIRRIEAVGAAEAAFRSISVDLADQRRLAAVGLETLVASRCLPYGEPRPGMIVSEPTGAGKSAAGRLMVAEAAAMAGVPVDASPARLVTLDTVGSVKSIWSSVLEGLGDPNFESGSETLQRKRVRKALMRSGIHLLIVDEFNHVADASQARRGVNAVKNLLTAGWTSVIVMGTSAELDNLPANEPFERRMVEHPGLPARVWRTDAESWTGYLAGLDEQIVSKRLLDERSGLDQPALAQALCSLCDGMIGDVHWLILESLKDAVRRGLPAISLPDLIANGDALLRKRPTGGINPLGALA